ncbi:MAG: hypothetical protein WAT23_18705 [Chromatiaceae bacterium]
MTPLEIADPPHRLFRIEAFDYALVVGRSSTALGMKVRAWATSNPTVDA